MLEDKDKGTRLSWEPNADFWPFEEHSTMDVVHTTGTRYTTRTTATYLTKIEARSSSATVSGKMQQRYGATEEKNYSAKGNTTRPTKEKPVAKDDYRDGL